MFKPVTDKINNLAEIYPESLKQLNVLFQKSTAVYIDFANVIHWSKKLKWHIDIKRLKQLFDSFNSIKYVHFYNGVVEDNEDSVNIIDHATKLGYIVTSKPVKRMNLSIDVSGIPKNSPSILQGFIKRALLNKFSIETIEYLNTQLEDLNNRGLKYIEHWKCNFDVEMGRDMLIDHEHKKIEHFSLWSGDSDFADPVNQLLKDGKNVSIFATARRISPELDATGVLIFEIWKIKDFICWNKEISNEAKKRLEGYKSKKDSVKSP